MISILIGITVAFLVIGLIMLKLLGVKVKTPNMPAGFSLRGIPWGKILGGSLLLGAVVYFGWPQYQKMNCSEERVIAKNGVTFKLTKYCPVYFEVGQMKEGLQFDLVRADGKEDLLITGIWDKNHAGVSRESLEYKLNPTSENVPDEGIVYKIIPYTPAAAEVEDNGIADVFDGT